MATANMADDDSETVPPAVITPLESAYIRAAITAVLPAINGLIYATNLDEVLHITKLTTNQVWQVCNALLIVVSVVGVIRKRFKEGNDPKSSASKIVLKKPDPPADPLEQLNKTVDTPGPKTQEQLLADYKARMKKLAGPTP